MSFTLIHAAIALTTGFAAFVSVAFAIGYALIALPILSLLVGTKTAIAIGLFFNVFTGAQFWFQRRRVSWPEAIAILPASLLATLVGLYFFFHVHEAGLSSLLALYLIVFRWNPLASAFAAATRAGSARRNRQSWRRYLPGR